MGYATVEDTFSIIPKLPRGNLLEFGVFNGNCMRRLIKGANDESIPFDEVWGFDSWIGLPAESPGVFVNPDWPEKAFSVMYDYKLDTDEKCVAFVEQRIWEYVDSTSTPPLNFVSGFFEQSLTVELGKQLTNTVSYCHVDCDIYKSTIDCLEWLFTHNVLKEGALVRFDDWLYGKPPGGNNLAFTKITAKYRILWSQLADNVFVYYKHNI